MGIETASVPDNCDAKRKLSSTIAACSTCSPEPGLDMIEVIRVTITDAWRRVLAGSGTRTARHAAQSTGAQSDEMCGRLTQA
jgi:hypothetical protein